MDSKVWTKKRTAAGDDRLYLIRRIDDGHMFLGWPTGMRGHERSVHPAASVERLAALERLAEACESLENDAGLIPEPLWEAIVAARKEVKETA